MAPIPSAPHEGVPEPAEYLEWDSQFFARRVARVRGQHLTPQSTAAILRWCAEQRIECLYLLAAPADPLTIELAGRNAFTLTDVRVALHRPILDLPPAPSGIRPLRPEDLPPLIEVARASFTDSRFFHDPRFERSRCEDLYAEWLESSCRGYADCVLVAEGEGERGPAGFVTCKCGADGEGNIGLIAVGPRHQGHGAGARLVTAALHYFRGHGMTAATVVTQARNIQSQRLYQRCGFLTQSIGLWYHRWETPPR